jgi:hypothetical protein
MALFRRSGVVAAAAAVMLAVAATGARTDDGAAGALTCDYTFNGWPGGFSADVRITNQGPPVTGWTVELTYAAPTTLGPAWLARMSQPDAVTMTAENLYFNPVIPSGGAVTFGWMATSAVHGIPAMSVNGAPC